jgi:hypothetical protein
VGVSTSYSSYCCDFRLKSASSLFQEDNLQRRGKGKEKVRKAPEWRDQVK